MEEIKNRVNLPVIDIDDGKGLSTYLNHLVNSLYELDNKIAKMESDLNYSKEWNISDIKSLKHQIKSNLDDINAIGVKVNSCSQICASSSDVERTEEEVKSINNKISVFEARFDAHKKSATYFSGLLLSLVVIIAGGLKMYWDSQIIKLHKLDTTMKEEISNNRKDHTNIINGIKSAKSDIDELFRMIEEKHEKSN